MILSVEFTVKGKLQRKRNAFPLKQWQCLLSFAPTSLYSSILPTHISHMQIILHFPDFAGDKSIAFDSSVFLASLILISNFEYYTTFLQLSSKLKDVSPTNTPQVLGIHSID